MVIFSIIALCVGLIVGTLVGYYIATTSTSARLVAISTMKKELPTLDHAVRVGWENIAHDLVSIEAHMLDDRDIFELLLISETDFKSRLVQLSKLQPRTNVEDIYGLVRMFTKVEIAFLTIDFARKAEGLYKSTHTIHAN